jgi:hypothetical protein
MMFMMIPKLDITKNVRSDILFQDQFDAFLGGYYHHAHVQAWHCSNSMTGMLLLSHIIVDTT